MSFNLKEDFIDEMEEIKKYNSPSEELIIKYQGKLMLSKDNIDIINILWKKYGFSSYLNGRFWLVNPEEFSSLAEKISIVSNDAIIFARTALGCLFVIDKINNQKSIFYINIHKNTRELVSTSMQVFLCFEINDNDFWKEECYNMELKIRRKASSLNYYECFTFIPALVLGGQESLENMEKVDMIPQLEILNQLHRK